MEEGDDEDDEEEDDDDEAEAARQPRAKRPRTGQVRAQRRNPIHDVSPEELAERGVIYIVSRSLTRATPLRMNRLRCWQC